MSLSSAIVMLHITAGSVVLVVAPAALAVRKGGAWHRRWGATFMWAMAGVTVTASLMWQAKGHLFLLFLDIISVYLVISGYRILARRRRPERDPRADALDLGAAAAAVAAGLALIWLGRSAATPLMQSLASVLVVLGTIGATFGGLDAFALQVGPRTRFGWMFYHLSAMMAAYISAASAFIVINAHGVPMLLRWLIPGLAGTIAITAFSAKYRLRYIRADRAAAAALRKRGATRAPEAAAPSSATRVSNDPIGVS